jgi:mRNA interferase RelE/StbE
MDMAVPARPIVYKPRARKPLLRMPRHVAQRLRGEIEAFAAGRTSTADIKPLRGRETFYRLRLGPWRAVFELTQGFLIVWLIGPRGQVYKDLSAMGL